MSNRKEAIKILGSIIEEVDIAMLTTVNEDGELHSRPMSTQEHHFDGDVWFFTRRTSDLAKDIQLDQRVNVSYGSEGSYASIAGHASIVTNNEKKKELWSPHVSAWFDGGPTSPEVVLIHVDAQSAQYWNSSSTLLGKAADLTKVLLTGNPEEMGESREIDFS